MSADGTAVTGGSEEKRDIGGSGDQDQGPQRFEFIYIYRQQPFQRIPKGLDTTPL